MTIIHGTAASPGIVRGEIYFLEKKESVPEKSFTKNREREWLRADAALKSVQSNLLDLGSRTTTPDREKGDILAANAQILEDPELLAVIREKIFNDNVKAEWAIHAGFRTFEEILQGQECEYLRARASDLTELCGRVEAVLKGASGQATPLLVSPSVIVSSSLSFTDLAILDESLILGICLEKGSHNDHAMIMARSLGIPAILDVDIHLPELQPGETILLDGDRGCIVAGPEPEILNEYQSRLNEKNRVALQIASSPDSAAMCRDHLPMRILANVSSEKAAKQAREKGAAGIGLVRTEFLFAGWERIPGEEEQYRKYREIADLFPGGEVVIRLFDLGSDKPMFGFHFDSEANPALGKRGIRLALSNVETLLKPQIKAILRIRSAANTRILIPMVTSDQEIRQCRGIIDECIQELEGAAWMKPEVGAMIEVPAAALQVDRLAGEADFFSIGTNDLCQYLFACDRTNPLVSRLGIDADIILFRLLLDVIHKAHRRGKKVSLCGEWGQNPVNLAFLAGAGIDTISVNPSFLPAACTLLSGLNPRRIERIVKAAMKCEDMQIIRDQIRSQLEGIES